MLKSQNSRNALVRYIIIPVLIIILSIIIWFSQSRYYVWFLKDRGFIIAKYVGDEAKYKAEFLLITEVDGNLTVELISGPGLPHDDVVVVVLSGGVAEDYLKRVGVKRENIIKDE